MMHIEYSIVTKNLSKEETAVVNELRNSPQFLQRMKILFGMYGFPFSDDILRIASDYFLISAVQAGLFQDYIDRRNRRGAV